MSMLSNLANFVTEAEYSEISAGAVEQLKIRVADSIACALGALTAGPPRAIRRMLQDLECSGLCTLMGREGLRGQTAAPDRAALYHGALVRYLDFNDSYLAPKETCHPSDSLGAVLASSDYMDADGKTFLLALAIAYQVQCRLSDVAPVRARGFDHTVQAAYAMSAASAKAMGLDRDQTANAIAISGTANNALRVTRTGALSNWKGLAAPYTGFNAVQAALLAKYGITGPPEVFEGNKGLMDTITGPFEIDWSKENLEKVRETILKKYNAEIHSQSVLEGILELRERHHLTPSDITRIDVDIFDVAYHIIGGGEEGGKKTVRTKEEADHSLPYLVAVALIDGAVTPAQYEPARILQEDVQSFLEKVEIHPDPDFTSRFPQEMPCRITLHLTDGEQVILEKTDYEGFITCPMGWEVVSRKFNQLTGEVLDTDLSEEILSVIHRLNTLPIRNLTRLLARVPIPANGHVEVIHISKTE